MGFCTIHSCSDCGIQIPHEILKEYMKSQEHSVLKSPQKSIDGSAITNTVPEEIVKVKIEEPAVALSWIKEEKAERDEEDDLDYDENDLDYVPDEDNFNEDDKKFQSYFNSLSSNDDKSNLQNTFTEPIAKKRKKHSQREKPNKKGKMCQICGEYFARAKSVQLHIDRIHNGDRVNCEICGISCTTNDIYPHYRLHGTTRNKVEAKLTYDIYEDLMANDRDINFDSNEDGHISENDINDHEESIVRCEICNIAFGDKNSKRKHLIHMHKTIYNTLYPCVVCKKDVRGLNLVKHFKSHGAFESEIIREEGIEPQLNVERLSEFQKNSLGSVTSLSQYYNTPKQCSTCGQSFSSQNNLTKHIRRVHDDSVPKYEQKVPCQVCGKEFAQKNLPRHIKYVHDKAKTLACGNCHKPFDTKTCLHRHMVDVNHMNDPVVTSDGSNNNPFACGLCQYAFVSVACWNYHSSKVHKGNTKPRCGYCGLLFESILDILNHLVSIHLMKHNGGECDICWKQEDNCTSGKQQDSFSIIEKPHPILACATCDKPFLTKERLNRHLNQGKHTGIKFLHHESGLNAFACLLCTKSFETYDCWHRHASTVHKNIYETKCGFCRKHFSTMMTSTSIKQHLLNDHLYQEANENCPDCLDGDGCNREKEQEKFRYTE